MSLRQRLLEWWRNCGELDQQIACRKGDYRFYCQIGGQPYGLTRVGDEWFFFRPHKLWGSSPVLRPINKLPEEMKAEAQRIINELVAAHQTKES